MKEVDKSDKETPDWGWFALFGVGVLLVIYKAAPSVYSLKGAVFFVLTSAVSYGLYKLANRYLPLSLCAILYGILIYVGSVTVLKSSEIIAFKNWVNFLTIQNGATAGFPHLLGALVGGIVVYLLLASNKFVPFRKRHVAGPQEVQHFKVSS